MTAAVVLKILGVIALVACFGAAYAEWGPQKKHYAWQRQRVRRDPSFGHFLANWAVSSLAMSVLVLFMIWYLRR